VIRFQGAQHTRLYSRASMATSLAQSELWIDSCSGSTVRAAMASAKDLLPQCLRKGPVHHVTRVGISLCVLIAGLTETPNSQIFVPKIGQLRERRAAKVDFQQARYELPMLKRLSTRLKVDQVIVGVRNIYCTARSLVQPKRDRDSWSNTASNSV
jgi:hypothetical protein